MTEIMIPPMAKSIGLSGRQGRKKQSLLTAARHNLRAIQAELGADSHIDASRICLNEILAGPDTPGGIDDLAQSLRAGIGFTPKRNDYTQAHEFVFTLSNDTRLDATAFFRFCLGFVAAEFGQENVLSAVVHRDEASPHCHILVLPVVAGRYIGSELVTKPSLAKFIEKFTATVVGKFEVRVMAKLAGEARSRLAQAVLERLQITLAPHVRGELLDAILKAAGRNPTPFLAPLGINMPPPGQATGDGGAAFRRIALSTGKGGKTERTRKPYGFGQAQFEGDSKPYGLALDGGHTAPKNRYHSCVVSANTPPPLPQITHPRDEATEADNTQATEITLVGTPQALGDIPIKGTELVTPTTQVGIAGKKARGSALHLTQTNLQAAIEIGSVQLVDASTSARLKASSKRPGRPTGRSNDGADSEAPKVSDQGSGQTGHGLVHMQDDGQGITRSRDGENDAGRWCGLGE